MPQPKSLTLGVDPGLHHGALALYDPVSNDVIRVLDVPTLTSSDCRTELDYKALSSILEPLMPLVRFAVIEQVSAMPKQGVTGVFRFGHATGLLTGIIAAHHIPIHQVRPAVWKSIMALSHNKDESRQKASLMFPHHANLFIRKKDDGRAEALLLAVFGNRFLPFYT